VSEYRKTYEDGLFFITLAIVGGIDVLNRPIYLEEIAKNLTYCQEKEGL
jgi:putative transposase